MEGFSVMGRVCQFCGKGILVGGNVSHANNKSKRILKPNLKSVRILFDGNHLRVKLCMNCLRRQKARMKEAALARQTTELIEKAKKGQEHFSIV